MSDSLRPRGPQHARPPCPSPTPGAGSHSCPLSQWCHPTISSCHPLLLLPSILPSIRVFSSESALPIRWPKDWSFSFSIRPNEHPGLISCRMDLVDLLAVQGTLKSLLQHHSLKASILQHSTFFIVQLSHPYMTSGKSIALTRWTFVGKVMSLLLICIHTPPLSWASLPPPSTPLGHHRALSRQPHATEQLPTGCLLHTQSRVDVPPSPPRTVCLCTAALQIDSSGWLRSQSHCECPEVARSSFQVAKKTNGTGSEMLTPSFPLSVSLCLSPSVFLCLPLNSARHSHGPSQEGSPLASDLLSYKSETLEQPVAAGLWPCLQGPEPTQLTVFSPLTWGVIGTRTSVTPWTGARQAPLSMGFSRQEHWSGLPFPSPGDLPDPGIEPKSPALQADSLPSEPPGKPFRDYTPLYFPSHLSESDLAPRAMYSLENRQLNIPWISAPSKWRGKLKTLLGKTWALILIDDKNSEDVRSHLRIK